MKIPVVSELFKANDKLAESNRRLFVESGVEVVNLVSSPGAGKTCLILTTAEEVGRQARLGVIEGDVAGDLDAVRVGQAGLPVVQIQTGGACHLDAAMISSALVHLDLESLDLLFIENVGNLVCPAGFDLGAQRLVVLASVPEGDDKPYKYPALFAQAQAVLVNKIDLQGACDFDLDRFRLGVRALNPEAPILPLSCRTGQGVEAWVRWLFPQAG